MRHFVAISLLLIAIGWFAPTSALPARADDASGTASAELETVIFAVDNMTCALCPITVRTAMSDVAGVTTVDVDFEEKTAQVTFDSTVASPDSIAEASFNAGYPAHPVD